MLFLIQNKLYTLKIDFDGRLSISLYLYKIIPGFDECEEPRIILNFFSYNQNYNYEQFRAMDIIFTINNSKRAKMFSHIENAHIILQLLYS